MLNVRIAGLCGKMSGRRSDKVAHGQLKTYTFAIMRKDPRTYEETCSVCRSSKQLPHASYILQMSPKFRGHAWCIRCPWGRIITWARSARTASRLKASTYPGCLARVVVAGFSLARSRIFLTALLCRSAPVARVDRPISYTSTGN